MKVDYRPAEGTRSVGIIIDSEEGQQGLSEEPAESYTKQRTFIIRQAGDYMVGLWEDGKVTHKVTLQVIQQR